MSGCCEVALGGVGEVDVVEGKGGCGERVRWGSEGGVEGRDLFVEQLVMQMVNQLILFPYSPVRGIVLVYQYGLAGSLDTV